MRYVTATDAAGRRHTIPALWLRTNMGVREKSGLGPDAAYSAAVAEWATIMSVWDNFTIAKPRVRQEDTVKVYVLMCIMPEEGESLEGVFATMAVAEHVREGLIAAWPTMAKHVTYEIREQEVRA